jgi:hypothetical protein
LVCLVVQFKVIAVQFNSSLLLFRGWEDVVSRCFAHGFIHGLSAQ